MAQAKAMSCRGNPDCTLSAKPLQVRNETPVVRGGESHVCTIAWFSWRRLWRPNPQYWEESEAIELTNSVALELTAERILDWNTRSRFLAKTDCAIAMKG
jgi:hypothetical protein